MNLEEVTDKLAEAMCMPDEFEQRSNRELHLATFIETYVPLMMEELRVLRNRNSFLELDNADLRNKLQEFEDE